MDENRPLHEDRDVDPWAIGKFVIGLVFFCGLSLLFLIGLFKYFEMSHPLRTVPVRRPSNVRLEESQTATLVKLRAAEDRILTTYDWVDRQKGVVRVPIQRAIDLLAQRGLPSRTPRPADEEPLPGGQRVSMPTESGLGVGQQ